MFTSQQAINIVPNSATKFISKLANQQIYQSVGLPVSWSTHQSVNKFLLSKETVVLRQ